MVWLAPQPRSWGGRSAVSRTRGRPHSLASMTAGSQCPGALPGGAQEGHRTSRGPRQAQGEEGGAALVEDGGQGQAGAGLGLALGRQHHRGGARPGGQDQVLHAPGQEPVEQGQGPAQVEAGGVVGVRSCRCRAAIGPAVRRTGGR